MLPTDVRTSLRPVRCLCRALGVSGRGARDVAHTLLWLLLAVAAALLTPKVVAGLGPLLRPEFRNMSRPEHGKELKEVIVVRMLYPGIVLATSTSARLISLLMVPARLSTVLRHLHSVDVLLHLPPTVQGADLRASVGMVVSFSVLGLLLGAHDIYWVLAYVRDTLQLLYYLLLFHNKCAAFAFELQFTNICFLIRRRFRTINGVLIHMSDSRTVARRRVNDASFNDSKPEDVLEMLRVCHRLLCDAVEEVNTLYRAQFIFSMVGCFLELVMYIYIAIFGLDFSSDARTVIVVCITVLRLLYYCIRIVTLALSASSTVDQASRAMTLACVINRRDLPLVVKEELALLCSHVSSRRVEFSACGLFTMDLQLLSSGVAASVTYLIIMVQFHS